MRLSILFLVLVGCSLNTFAQFRTDTTKVYTYLLPEFTSGNVLMKSGKFETALLNYDTYTQSIVFLSGDKIMTLVGLEDVDTIYIQTRKFVPGPKNVIFEVINGANNFGPYVSYVGKVVPLTANATRSGSERERNGQVNNAVTNSYVNRIYLSHGSLDIHNVMWMKNGNTFYKVSTESQFVKNVPSALREKLKTFISSNNIHYTELPEVKKLFDYYYSVASAR